MGVQSISEEVAHMRKLAAACVDIAKGGDNMRAMGKTYLPKFPLESDDDYTARLESAWLFNGIDKAIGDITGRIFEKPVVLKTQEGRLSDWCQNVDLEGRDLSNFAKNLFEQSLPYGISFCLADAPQRPQGAMTTGEVTSLGLRPSLVALSLDQVLGWKWEMVANEPVLTQFRIIEKVADPARDQYSDAKVDQIRVFDVTEGRVTITLHRKSAKGAWEADEPLLTDMDRIYVAPFYTGRVGYFQSKPPLAPIAELNLAHWRKQSDMDSCEHKSLSPILHLKHIAGVGEDGKAVINSAGYAFFSNHDGAEITWAEVSGSGIAGAKVTLVDIKDQMRQMGLQIISERTGVTTATGENSDEKKTTTRIRMWADDLKDTLEIALGWMAEIGGITADTEVVVHKDFGGLGSMPMSDIKDMYAAGVISRVTYINEAKRRGLLDEDVTPEDEAELIEAEGMGGELDTFPLVAPVVDDGEE